MSEVITVCCGRGKCPQIYIEENKDKRIVDDYGNEAYFNGSQFDELKRKIINGEFD